MIITKLTKYIIVIAGNTVKGIINVNYKIIMKVLIEIYFKVIAKRSVIFIRN